MAVIRRVRGAGRRRHPSWHGSAGSDRDGGGLDAARGRGHRGGRRRKRDAKKRAQAFTLHQDKSNTIEEICRTLRVGRSTFYPSLAKEQRR
ncbi:MAG: helix-turn-helix domain-containing protein [Planctomycetaceae bacterium]|nr:helix-turn-helix domain-containing protein [Planctomycetaceae bacterium]